MINPCIYVIVNKSLKMNPGKVAAQVAHATASMMSALANTHTKIDWHQINPRTVIVLECEDADAMIRFSKYLTDSSINLIHYIYTDESSNFNHTCMAIEPVDEADLRTDLIFRQFKLYTHDYEKESISHIEKLHYDNLRKHFNNLVKSVLGEDYYNLGTDTYNCDRLACEDIKQKSKGKWWRK